MILNIPLMELKDSANTIKQYTDDNSDLFDQILNLLNAAENSGEWKGLTVQVMQGVTARNQKSFRQCMQELNSLADFLSGYADAMSDEDARIAQQIRNI